MTTTATAPPRVARSGLALADVEASMRAALDHGLDDPTLAAAARHHLERPGKRRRAALALSTAAAVGLDRDDALAIAGAVELLHEASLLHDDLQDRAETRRGAATVRRRFDDATALLLGDVAIAAAFASLAALPARAGALPLIPALHAAVATTASGQRADTAASFEGGDLARYVEVAAAKSGPLFALPLGLVFRRIGDGAAARRGDRAAREFAVAYQLYDDARDAEADAAAGETNALVLLTAAHGDRAAAERALRREIEARLRRAHAAAATLPCGGGAGLEALCDDLLEEAARPWT